MYRILITLVLFFTISKLSAQITKAEVERKLHVLNYTKDSLVQFKIDEPYEVFRLKEMKYNGFYVIDFSESGIELIHTKSGVIRSIRTYNYKFIREFYIGYGKLEIKMIN